MKINKLFVILLSAVAAVFIALIVCASTLLPFYQITIDKFFLGQGADSDNYDDSNAKIVAQELAEDGIVLLKNETKEGGGNEKTLPLIGTESDPVKISLFGVGGGNMELGGLGSAGGDASNAAQFDAALQRENISVCPELFEFYESKGETGNTGTFDDIGKDINSKEVSIESMSDDVKEAAKAYSDTAVYVISRVGAEGSKFTTENLSLSEFEEKTLDYIVENYETVILVMNTANAMEFGFIEGRGTSRKTNESFAKYEGKIDAALWVGLPGYMGREAVSRVLSGSVNPSGRLPDTYAYDVNSSPSVTAKSNAEGLYYGYKWYETAAYEGAIDYDDYDGSAGQLPYHGTGTSVSETRAQGVLYPFGYGISYTTFSKEIVSEGTDMGGTFTEANADEDITIKVRVTNTGDVAGKEVVQAYLTPQYNEGGIEKAYINLIDFAKTDVLEPDESEVVEIKFALSDMKSFDDKNANKDGHAGYELESGDYYIRILDNSHEWTSVELDDAKSLKYTVAETIYYDTDDKTGVVVEPLFEDYYDNGVTYLSRKDGFANASAVTSTDSSKTKKYVRDDYTDETNDYTAGVDYDVELDEAIMFDEMVGVSFADKKWDTFISQLTKVEMAELITQACFETRAIERLGVPKTLLFDGPAAIKDTYSGDCAMLYPSEVLLAATFSKESLSKFGESAGDDAVQWGVTGWYAPGLDLHLNPFVTRNFEFFSEDAVLSGKLAAAQIEAAQAKGVVIFAKHLLNGIGSAVNEQVLREYYIKPFEFAIKDGGAKGVMTTNNIAGVWIGECPEILTTMLRGEWGMQGVVTSDAVGTPDAMRVREGIRAGNDMFLGTDASRRITLISDEDNIGAMQECCKRILYTLSTSSIALSAEIVDVGWSPSMLILGIVDGVSAIIVLLCGFLIARHIIKTKRIAEN